MTTQGLLKKINECEYPDAFLVSRLLGKRGTLFRDWEFLIKSSDAVKSLQGTPFYPYLRKYGTLGIQRFLRDEHLWVYKRMNNRLRNSFQSYFIYHEMSILIVCLRYLSVGKEIEHARQELNGSLLHDDIISVLTSDLDFSVMLQELECHLGVHTEIFKGLCAHYNSKGIAALETFIRDRFFVVLLSQKQPSLLTTFLKYLVDYHNCLALAKNLRWQSEWSEQEVISGGTVPPERLKRAYFRKDLTPVLKFLRLQDADEAASAVHQIETSLLHFISRKLRTWSFQRTVVGDILFYLWEQQRYTRNISMILKTKLLDDELVRGDIVS